MSQKGNWTLELDKKTKTFKKLKACNIDYIVAKHHADNMFRINSMSLDNVKLWKTLWLLNIRKSQKNWKESKNHYFFECLILHHPEIFRNVKFFKHTAKISWGSLLQHQHVHRILPGFPVLKAKFYQWQIYQKLLKIILKTNKLLFFALKLGLLGSFFALLQNNGNKPFFANPQNCDWMIRLKKTKNVHAD